MLRQVIAAAMLVIMLTACGTSTTDRTLSGAAIGSGAGTAASLIFNSNPVTGLLVGTAAGAITGAATSDKDFNLGKPVWDTWQY